VWVIYAQSATRFASDIRSSLSSIVRLLVVGVANGQRCVRCYGCQRHDCFLQQCRGCLEPLLNGAGLLANTKSVTSEWVVA
jgi:hypothetical protein